MNPTQIKTTPAAQKAPVTREMTNAQLTTVSAARKKSEGNLNQSAAQPGAISGSINPLARLNYLNTEVYSDFEMPCDDVKKNCNVQDAPYILSLRHTINELFVQEFAKVQRGESLGDERLEEKETTIETWGPKLQNSPEATELSETTQKQVELAAARAIAIMALAIEGHDLEKEFHSLPGAAGKMSAPLLTICLAVPDPESQSMIEVNLPVSVTDVYTLSRVLHPSEDTLNQIN